MGLNRNDGPHTHTLIHLSLFKTDLWSTLCINPFNHTLSLSLSMSRKSNIERASAACNFALFNHMTWVLLFESFPSKRLLPLSIKSLSLSFLFLIYVGVIKNKKSDNACYVLLFYLIIPFFVKSLLCNF